MASLPPDDAEVPLVPLVEPNPGLAKTVGVLNIVFGALLMLCGICAGANLGLQSALSPMMAAQREQMQQTMRAGQQAQLKKLQDEIDATDDEEEKAALQAKLKVLQAQPVPVMPDTSKWMTAPEMKVYVLADAITGSVLNLLMLISGVGLVALKEWARRLALWVASLKILRLAALYGYFAVAVAPVVAQQFREMMEEMSKAQPPGQKGFGPDQLAQVTTTIGMVMTGTAIAMIVLGSIYPLVQLVLLTRPGVRAACAGRLPEYGVGPPA
jgi:hypothetical protein